MLLEGKRVVITGSGKGLGRAYATAMAAEGARIVVNDVDASAAQGVADEITSGGGSAVVSTDTVNEWESARRIIGRCVAAYGGIDVLVNNAGVAVVKPIYEVTEQDFDLMTQVNLKGTFNCTRHALEHMVPLRSGSIINISSMAQGGAALHSIYSGTKAGISGFTYSWAVELSEYGIRVNAISPAARTPMVEHIASATGQDMSGMPLPNTIAPLAVYLASDESSWVTGQIVNFRGRELSLVSHPRSIHVANRINGWTIEDIRDHFATTLLGKLEPVSAWDTEYPYYSGVGDSPRSRATGS